MASARCQHVRGVCIAGKPGSYSWRGLCWSWLACDGLGAVSVSARRLHRGQARLLQLARALLELACLRWPRRGASECAASASRASPAPAACAGSVGAGLPAMASARCQHVRGVCIAGKPGSYSWRGLCWSWLACDGLGAVSVSARRLHRGQARLPQGSARDTACSVSVRPRHLHRWQANAPQVLNALTCKRQCSQAQLLSG